MTSVAAAAQYMSLVNSLR